jgi:predicted Rdx family selenoprotein
MSDDPPRPASLPPGYDEDSPYDGTELEALPAWWRENVDAFRRHGMRPYRPPRFADGTVTTEVINDLEADLGVSVRIRALNPHTGGGWEIVVDGESVDRIERERTEGGYSKYGVTAGEFEEIVTKAAGE